MKGFLAYFDILGFKSLVENNDLENLTRLMHNLVFLKAEKELSGNKFVEIPMGYMPDLSKSKINCLHISDSILFFIDEKQHEHLGSFMTVCYKYNMLSILQGLPMRGAVVYGEYSFTPIMTKSESNTTWVNGSLFGKALVDAHTLAESQEWAGCIIDNSVLVKINGQNEIIKELEKTTQQYPVPIKAKDTGNVIQVNHTVFNIIEGGNIKTEMINGYKENINKNFTSFGKKIDTESAARKLENTLEFFKSFCEKIN